jgi:hypothetical protein
MQVAFGEQADVMPDVVDIVPLVVPLVVPLPPPPVLPLSLPHAAAPMAITPTPRTPRINWEKRIRSSSMEYEGACRIRAAGWGFNRGGAALGASYIVLAPKS